MTSYTVGGLTAGATYYFVVRAHDVGGVLSAASNEVAGMVKVPGVQSAPSSCRTPDPFTALGGGICRSGGWLPPGMTPAPELPASVPAPPALVAAGCVTPDPFQSLGGGTCRNGGWLPPGMAGPAAPPPPPTASAPAPVNPAIATAPDDDGSCAMADPFQAINGLVGVCRVGGWSPWPGVTTTATAQLQTDDGHFVLVGDDGVTYVLAPDAVTPAVPLIEGLRVRIRAVYEPSTVSPPPGVRIIRILDIAPE